MRNQVGAGGVPPAIGCEGAGGQMALKERRRTSPSYAGSSSNGPARGPSSRSRPRRACATSRRSTSRSKLQFKLIQSPGCPFRGGAEPLVSKLGDGELHLNLRLGHRTIQRSYDYLLHPQIRKTPFTGRVPEIVTLAVDHACPRKWAQNSSYGKLRPTGATLASLDESSVAGHREAACPQFKSCNFKSPPWQPLHTQSDDSGWPMGIDVRREVIAKKKTASRRSLQS
jgi:hypothetical protein